MRVSTAEHAQAHTLTVHHNVVARQPQNDNKDAIVRWQTSNGYIVG